MYCNVQVYAYIHIYLSELTSEKPWSLLLSVTILLTRVLSESLYQNLPQIADVMLIYLHRENESVKSNPNCHTSFTLNRHNETVIAAI